MKVRDLVIGGVAFIIGAGIGSGVTYLIMKNRHNYELDHYCDECFISAEYKKEHPVNFNVNFNKEEFNTEQHESVTIRKDDSVDATVHAAQYVENDGSYSSALKYEQAPAVPYVSPEEDRAYLDFINSKKNERVNRLKNKNYIRYNKRDFDDEYEEVNEVHEVDEEQLKRNNYQPKKPIQIITPQQFAEECYGYSKNTLQWWRRNNLMSTEDYEIVDVPDLIGTEWINRIGEFEPNVVYVRNDNAESDYEIIVSDDNYYDFNG